MISQDKDAIFANKASIASFVENYKWSHSPRKNQAE